MSIFKNNKLASLLFYFPPLAGMAPGYPPIAPMPCPAMGNDPTPQKHEHAPLLSKLPATTDGAGRGVATTDGANEGGGVAATAAGVE